MTEPETGQGADVNPDTGLPWWYPDDFEVTPDLLAAEAETQDRIRQLPG